MSHAPLQAPGWYVDVDGQRAGPFSIEQIQALLQNGKIKPDQPVYDNASGPSTRVVYEFLDDYTDPALSLFDTLQAAREKKAQRRHFPVQQVQEPRSWFEDWLESVGLRDTLKKVPSQFWLIASITGVLVALIWGASSMLKQGGSMIATPGAEKTAAPVAVKPVSPPQIKPVPPPVPQPKVTSPLATRIFQRPPASVGRPMPVATPISDPRDDRDRDRDRDPRDQDQRDYRDLRDRDPRDDERGNPLHPADRDPGSAPQAVDAFGRPDPYATGNPGQPGDPLHGGGQRID